ncbi:MAG TPA: nitrous oxide reductase family maturation protein NosD [Bacteroidia bacterium]|nr:nitrous oxide reductase family maturation protein NosD [Bacteroidia bacterium]
MERHQSIQQKISCLFFFALFFPAVSQSATWTVRKNTQLTSVQQAVDLAQPHDTILVHPGTYFEKNILIKKPLLLRGINNPVLDGQKKYEIISIWSSHVTVRGFTLRNCGKSSMNDYAGIKIYNANHVTIANNILNDMFFGIYFQGCGQSTASGNILQSFGKEELQSGNGIHCWKCDSMTIDSNNVSGQRDGIYFEFVTASVIRKNFSHQNIRYGLHFMFSHHNDYLYNIFENNGAGVAVMYTNHVRMENNIFKDNWGSAAYGLLLKEISDSHVENNKFTNNSSGIYMEGSNRIAILKNNFENNGCALRIQASCDNNSIVKNNFQGNTFDITTNGSVSLNSFLNNYWDKYEGYDLNRDGTGDVPYHPVSVYSMIIERMPIALLFIRSFMVTLLERTEKAIPSITPENFKDNAPFMKPLI